MRKIIFKLIMVLFVLIIIALGIGWALIDTLAEKGIEKGATYALGVETTVDDVDLSLLNSSLELEGLKISNPPNFGTPHLMKMDKLETELVASSLMGDTVEVTKFEIDGLDVYIEQTLTGSNVSKIMENLEKLSSGKKPDEEGAGGKKVKIGRILITNTVAHLNLGGLAEGTVKIPEILLTDVTSDNANGVVMSELTAKLVTAILSAVLEEAGEQMPLAGSMLGILQKQVSGVSESFGIGEILKIETKTDK